MKISRFIYVSIASVAVAIALQSCLAAKKYKRPELGEVEGNELYRNVEVEIDSQSVAEISWDRFFDDPILQDHISTALSDNLDLQIAAENVLIAEAFLKQGKAGYWPSIDANIQVNRQDIPDNAFNGPFADNNYSEYILRGNLNWEADVWGRIRSNKRALEASFYQSDAVRNTIQASLVASIASLYYELLSLDAKLVLVNKAIENRTNAVTAIRGLKEAGMANEVGVQQTLALKYNADAVKVNVENDIRLLENAFSILLGREPGPINRGEFRNIAINAPMDTGVPYRLLQNRPDVIASEYRLREAFELTNVARANFYPSFTLGAGGGLLSTDLDDWFNASSLFSNVVAGLTQPIFRRRQIKTQFEVAESQQRQALLDFRQALLIAGREVSDALYNKEAAEKLAEIKFMELEANTKATRYSATLLTQGYADYLEVLNANTNQLISEFQYVNAKLRVLQSQVELYRALGGGWR